MTAAKLDLSAFEGHTPGPWKVRKTSTHTAVDSVADPKDPYTVLIDSLTGDKAMDRQFRTDARLIAAAPALLAECKRLQASEAALREALHSAYDANYRPVWSHPGSDPQGHRLPDPEWAVEARAALEATK